MRKFAQARQHMTRHRSKKLITAAGKSTFKRSTIVNSNFVLVKTVRTEISVNRPIAVGFCISDMAKLVMYYEALLPKYCDKFRLLFSDTDSFFFFVETSDLHADMAGMMQWLNTSNFPSDHPLYSTANKRKLGYFKSETGAHCPSEFVGLRSKMYICGRRPPTMTDTRTRKRKAYRTAT